MRQILSQLQEERSELINALSHDAIQILIYASELAEQDFQYGQASTKMELILMYLTRMEGR